MSASFDFDVSPEAEEGETRGKGNLEVKMGGKREVGSNVVGGTSGLVTSGEERDPEPCRGLWYE